MPALARERLQRDLQRLHASGSDRPDRGASARITIAASAGG